MQAFSFQVRVYLEDTDAQGVVYNASYFRFMERARTEWLRRQGFDQDALMRESGIVFAVRHVNIDYLLPARLDDTLTVEAAVDAVSKVSLTFRQRILRAPDTLLSTASVKVVCLDSETFRPTAIPRDIREKLHDAQH